MQHGKQISKRPSGAGTGILRETTGHSLGSPIPAGSTGAPKAVAHCSNSLVGVCYWQLPTLPQPFWGGSLGVTAAPTSHTPGDASLGIPRPRDTPPASSHPGLSPHWKQGYSHPALSPESPCHRSRHYYYKSYCLQCPPPRGTAIPAGHGSSPPPRGPWPSTGSDIIKMR